MTLVTRQMTRIKMQQEMSPGFTAFNTIRDRFNAITHWQQQWRLKFNDKVQRKRAVLPSSRMQPFAGYSVSPYAPADVSQSERNTRDNGYTEQPS